MRTVESICLIEDDPIQIFLLKKHLEKVVVTSEILVFQNGMEAFIELKKLFEESGMIPSIILLDLNMPIWNGWIFLDEYVKLVGGKFALQVHIFTSSDSEEDIERAKQFGLESKFLRKPVGVADLKGVFGEM